VSFIDCVLYCTKNRELVKEYDRLSGSSLGSVLSAAPMSQMIDDATGRTKEELDKFAAFVMEFVWLRLPQECFQ
jgi:hypothetical protein